MRLNSAIKIMIIVVLVVLCWAMIDYVNNGMDIELHGIPRQRLIGGLAF